MGIPPMSKQMMLPSILKQSPILRSLVRRIQTPVSLGFVSPMRSVPKHILQPDYSQTGQPIASPNSVILFKNEKEIEKIRKASLLARKMLEFACSLVKPGVSTEEIDELVHNEVIRNGAYPSPINYFGFPKAICTSINEVICHGIPDDRRLEAGDVISIDVSVFLQGDNCGTVIVGNDYEKSGVGRKDGGLTLKEIDDFVKEGVQTYGYSSLLNQFEAQDVTTRLLVGTKAALQAAIDMCKPGSCLSDIGNTIESLANHWGMSVVNEFCGHGVGPSLHMQPLVRHFSNSNKLVLREGMIFTIEPILVEGRGTNKIQTLKDGWTASTVQGVRGAQFEHQILITKNGAEILTLPTYQ